LERLIYSLCDYSGEWIKPYQEAGYKCIQIDLKFGDDVRLLKLPDEPVFGVVAAPPCTTFAGSGAKWYNLRSISEVLEGLSIVDACYRFATRCQPEFWCIENPVGILPDWYGQPDYYFDPCDFGDPYTKKTCLWGDFSIPTRSPVEPTMGSKMHVVEVRRPRQSGASLHQDLRGLSLKLTTH